MDTGSRLYLGADGKLHIQYPSDTYHPEQPKCGIADLSLDAESIAECEPHAICEGCAKVYARDMIIG